MLCVCLSAGNVPSLSLLPHPTPSSSPSLLLHPPPSPPMPYSSCWSMIRLTSLTIYLHWSAWTPPATCMSLQHAKMEVSSADFILLSTDACKGENTCLTFSHFMLDITVLLKWMTSSFCTHRLRTLYSTHTDAGTGMSSLLTRDVMYDYCFGQWE